MTRFTTAPGFVTEPIGDSEVAARQAFANPSFAQSIYDAGMTEWSVAWAAKQVKQWGYDTYDPDFKLEDHFESLTEGLTPELWQPITEARSLSHAAEIRSQMLDTQERRQRLANAGVTGTVLTFAAAMLDPVDIAIAAASGGLGSIASGASKAARIRRMVETGLVASATATPVELYRTSQDPFRDEWDVIYTAMGSFGLGAAFRGVGDSIAAQRAAKRVQKAIELNDVRVGMGAAARGGGSSPEIIDMSGLTPDGQLYFREFVDPDEASTLVSRWVESSLDPIEDAEIIAETLRQVDPNVAVNLIPRDRLPDDAGDFLTTTRGDSITPEVQSRTTGTDGVELDAFGYPLDEPPVMLAGDLDLSTVNDASIGMEWMRRIPNRLGGMLFNNYITQLGNKATPARVRLAGNLYASDRLGYKRDGSPVRMAAVEFKQHRVTSQVGKVNRQADLEFGEYRKANNLSLSDSLDTGQARARFEEEVGITVRQLTDPDFITNQAMLGKTTANDPVMRAAKAYSDSFKEMIEIAQRHRVKGFAEIESIASYFTRIWSPGKVNDRIGSIGVFGQQAMEGFFERAILAKQLGIEADEAAILAKGMLRTIRKLDDWDDIDRARFLKGDRPDLLADILRDEGISEDRIARILGATKAKDGSGVISYAKRRVDLDESFEAMIAMPDGQNVHIRMSDFLENNANRVHQAYANKLIGESARAEVFRVYSEAVGRKPGQEITTWEQMATELRKAGASEQQVELFKMLDRNLRGVPIRSLSASGEYFEKAGRVIRAGNYLQYGGTFGVASLPEPAALVARLGLKTTLQSIPEAMASFKAMRRGDFSVEDASDLVWQVGRGFDGVSHRFTSTLDEPGSPARDVGSRVDKVLYEAQRAVSTVSGMRAVTDFGSRLAIAGATRNFYKMAKSYSVAVDANGNRIQTGRLPSKNKMAAMGMSPEEGEMVIAAMRKEIDNGTIKVYQKSDLSRQRGIDVRIDDWEDQYAASLFVRGLQRFTTNAIQTQDMSSVSPMMSSTLGKIMFQFKNFAYVAWESQLLYRLQMRDMEAFVSGAVASFTAAMAYSAQTYLRSLGREDAQEYRDQMLTTEKIIAAGVQRAGWASFLPSMFDNIAYTAGYEGPFQYTRNTQLSTGIFNFRDGFDFSNPTLQNFSNLMRAGTAIPRAVFGSDTITDADMRAAIRMLPFRNFIGVENVLNQLLRFTPERADE